MDQLIYSDSHFLSEIFDRRTLLEMEAALDRAIKDLPFALNDHEIRTFVAGKIIDCVVSGQRTEDAMVRAAYEAVNELAERQKSDGSHRTCNAQASTSNVTNTILV